MPEAKGQARKRRSSKSLASWLQSSPSGWIAWAGSAIGVFGAPVVASFALGALAAWLFAVTWGLPLLSPANQVSAPDQQSDFQPVEPPVQWDVAADFVVDRGDGTTRSLSSDEKEELRRAVVNVSPSAFGTRPNIDKFGRLNFSYAIPSGKEFEDEISSIQVLHDKWIGTLTIDTSQNQVYDGGILTQRGKSTRNFTIRLLRSPGE